jgi:hypothetical protein
MGSENLGIFPKNIVFKIIDFEQVKKRNGIGMVRYS